MILRSTLAAALSVAAALFAAPAAERNPRDFLLSNTGLPPITAEEKSLRDVPYGQGAPAVVLVNAEQDDWTVRGALHVKRTQIFRRIKILKEAAVHDYGSYTIERYGDLHLEQVDARTVLPDGTLVDASRNVHEDRSELGYRMLTVSFPQVQVGAILDVQVSFWTEDQHPYARFWTLQERLPVRESRLVWIPPAGMDFQVLFRNVASEVKPTQVFVENKDPAVSVRKRTAYVWAFTAVEPAPREPHQPPDRDIAPTLYVLPTSFPDAAPRALTSKTWKAYAAVMDKDLGLWIKARDAEARRAAAQATAGKETAQQKLEGVREYLQQKFRVTSFSSFPRRESPDDALALGSGSSADAAMLAVTMLRAAGVKADPATYRRGTSGAQPPPAIIADLFNDMLVRVTMDKGPIYWSPARDLPPGVLSPDARGVLVMPIGTGAAGPEQTPVLPPAENRRRTTTTARLDAEGTLEAETVLTYSALRAEATRGMLRQRGEESRRDLLREWLGRVVTGAEVTKLEIENLDAPDRDLTIKLSWRADNAAVHAGDRLLFGTVLFDREAAEDWAAEKRQVDVDLGDPRDDEDVLILTLPDKTVEAKAPLALHLEHPEIGAYAVDFEVQPGKVVARRQLRLDSTYFPPQAWGVLRDWFGKLAAADENRLVLKLGD